MVVQAPYGALTHYYLSATVYNVLKENERGWGGRLGRSFSNPDAYGSLYVSPTHKNTQNKRRHLRYSGNRFFLILLPNSKISRGPMTTICIIMLASKSNDCVQAERTT